MTYLSLLRAAACKPLLHTRQRDSQPPPPPPTAACKPDLTHARASLQALSLSHHHCQLASPPPPPAPPPLSASG